MSVRLTMTFWIAFRVDVEALAGWNCLLSNGRATRAEPAGPGQLRFTTTASIAS